MNKLVVEIYLPAAGKSYDVRIPSNARIGEIIPLVESCMADLAGGYYIPGQNSILCERTTGIELDVNLTPCEMGIINGARLMLI